MTPAKEKAIELVRQFYSIGANECKQCALIAVDEILKGENNFIQTNEHYKYWYEVKQEIYELWHQKKKQ